MAAILVHSPMSVPNPTAISPKAITKPMGLAMPSRRTSSPEIGLACAAAISCD